MVWVGIRLRVTLGDAVTQQKTPLRVKYNQINRWEMCRSTWMSRIET